MTTYESRIPPLPMGVGVEAPVDHAECEHGVMLSERTYGTLDCPLHDGRSARITYILKSAGSEGA